MQRNAWLLLTQEELLVVEKEKLLHFAGYHSKPSYAWHLCPPEIVLLPCEWAPCHAADGRKGCQKPGLCISFQY